MTWQPAVRQEVGLDLSQLSDKERLCVSVQEARLAVETAKAAIADLLRTSKIKDRELAVLKREERALGLVKLRQEKEKLQLEIQTTLARLQDESNKTVRTRKMVEDLESDMAVLRQRTAEEETIVEMLKRKRFECERELATLRGHLLTQQDKQTARRAQIETEVSAVERQLELDARIRQKLASLNSYSDTRIGQLKELKEKETLFTEKSKDALFEELDKE